MATAAQRAVMIAGTAGGLGFSSYYFSQMKEVQKIEKDKKDIEQLIDSERKRVAQSSKAQTEQEQRISEVDSQVRDGQKAVKEVEGKLEAARKQVELLEQELKGKTGELKVKQADLASAQSRLAELRADAERAKQSFTMGEKSLLLANQKIAEAKLLTNPLNHPKIKSFLGRK